MERKTSQANMKCYVKSQESVDPIIIDDIYEIVNDDGTVSNNNDVENGASDNMEAPTESLFQVKNADADEEDKNDGEVVHEKKGEMVNIESHEETIVESNSADGNAQNKQTTITIVTKNQSRRKNEKKSKVVTKKSQPQRRR